MRFKSFKSIVFLALMAAVFASLLWAGTGFTAEGSKSMRGEMPPIVVTVPEQAPEFLCWESGLVGMEQYPNGNALILVQYINPAENVIVSALWVKMGENFYLVAFAAFYEVTAGAPGEIYEDVGFIKDGKPTGVLVRVAEADPIEAFKSHASKLEI